MRRQASDGGFCEAGEVKGAGGASTKGSQISCVLYTATTPVVILLHTLLWLPPIQECPFPVPCRAPSYSSFKAQLGTTSSRQPSMSLMNHSSTTTVPTVPCSIHSYALLPPSLDCQFL